MMPPTTKGIGASAWANVTVYRVKKNPRSAMISPLGLNVRRMLSDGTDDRNDDTRVLRRHTEVGRSRSALQLVVPEQLYLTVC
jgi:hypothetical protein